MSLPQGTVTTSPIAQIRILLFEIDPLSGFIRSGETSLSARPQPDGMDLITYGLLAAVLAFFFFMYLMLRRTFLGFREGLENSREK